MTGIQKGRFSQLAQNIVHRLGQAGVRSAKTIRNTNAKLAERLFDAKAHLLTNGLGGKIKAATTNIGTTTRAYGQLGRAKGLRAVNIGALKVVDALEGVGAIRPRQAKKVRIGILSADVHDTMPFTRETDYSDILRSRRRYSEKPMTESRLIEIKGENPNQHVWSYSEAKKHFFDPEVREYRKENTSPKRSVFYEDMPKGVKEQFDDMAEYGLGGPYREGRSGNKTKGTYRMDTENMDSRLADSLNQDDYFDRIFYDKERKRNSLYPHTEKPRSAKQKFDNAINRQYLNEVVAPTGNRRNEMHVARRNAVPKLRDNYTALRSAAGKAALIAGLGGAGGLALMMAANRKKNEQSGNSGRVNKSMAKRANTSSKYFR